MTELTAIVEPKFSAIVTHSGEEIVIQLTGNADVAAKQHLAGLLRVVHTQAQERGVGHVRFDIRNLAFMNSSCFKDLISWLDGVREATTVGRYRVTFMSSAALHWQRRSLHALSCFARDLVTVEAA
jgi:hypothetical protein